MKTFQRPSQEDLLSYQELQDRKITEKIVKDGETLWYVKMNYNEDIKKREKLAYLIGSPWANIAEVDDIDDIELEQLAGLGIVSSDNKRAKDIYLVRLAQSYSVADLPQRDLTLATARELVYSLLVRRRDAHQKNRVYISGVPISFDYHVAFLQEGEGLRTEDGFYSREPKDWRVKMTEQTISTQSLLSFSGYSYTHFVHDLEVYKQEVQGFCEVIRTDKRNYVQVATTAGFNRDEATTVSTFIEESRNNLNPLRLIQVTTQDL